MGQLCQELNVGVTGGKQYRAGVALCEPLWGALRDGFLHPVPKSYIYG